MTEIGKVTKIDGDRITIHCRPSAACHSCAGGTCGARDREIAARNVRGVALNPGDHVEIFLPSAQAVTAGLKVFILPVSLFAAFYAGAPRLGVSAEEGPRVLAGLAGLALGFLSVFLISRRSQNLPEVVRVVPEEELQALAAGEAEKAGNLAS
jgi:positive regulator of sigma E activity